MWRTLYVICERKYKVIMAPEHLKGHTQFSFNSVSFQINSSSANVWTSDVSIWSVLWCTARRGIALPGFPHVWLWWGGCVLTVYQTASRGFEVCPDLIWSSMTQAADVLCFDVFCCTLLCLTYQGAHRTEY